MRRIAKTKIATVRVLPRRAAAAATVWSRRDYPAWIDASDRGVSFSATCATPRVRDGLVLRLVAQKRKIGSSRRTPDAHGGR